MKFSFSLFSILSTAFVSTHAGEIVSIHGSGTTNPSKCYWHIMDQLQVQAKNNIRLTYRAVGSSVGQTEFIGEDGTTPDNDFGSGDLPFNSEQYTQLTQTAGVGIVQLPVVMGAVSFFHSLPIGDQPLKLSPCVLAKIFLREIKDWTDPEIRALNPDWEFATPFPITVARRVYGSSSTSGISKFLRMSCPEVWPEDMVGKELVWDPETKGCEGSGGVTDCIRADLGTIGYIDAGHGHAEGLKEVELENKFGTFLTSKVASEMGGIVGAATSEGSGIPDAVDQDFSSTQLLNQDGKYTWPIVAISYLYVRKDLPSFIPDPEAQTLLIGFIRALYRDEFISECESEFGFFRVTGSILEKALAGIDMLQTTEGAPVWDFELKTAPRVGQLDYIFSAKRQSYSEVEQDKVVEVVGKLQQQIDDLKAQNIVLQDTVTMLEENQNQVIQQQQQLQRNDRQGDVAEANNLDASVDAIEEGDEDFVEFTEDEATQLKAALALSVVSFVCCIVGLMYLILKVGCGI